MSETMENIFNQIKNIFEFTIDISIQLLQTTFVYLIFFGSSVYVHMAAAFKQLCEKYPELNEFVEKCTVAINSFEKNLQKIFANYRFEPEYSPWISIVWMDGDNDFSEDYFNFSEEIYSENSMRLYYDIWMKECMQKSMDGNDGIIIMKCGDKTLCNMIEKYDEKNTFEPSNVKLLAIEYKHPAMNEPVLIQLDRSWFLCGNQLLSQLFVRRYLDYQPSPFYFDGKYTITIIDNNMNITKIDETQYVVIEKDTYRIIENEFDILSVDSVEKSDDLSEEKEEPIEPDLLLMSSEEKEALEKEIMEEEHIEEEEEEHIEEEEEEHIEEEEEEDLAK
jgi:hypothetical protein